VNTASFLDDLKSYAQQAVLVRRAVTISPENHALADALNLHISLFQSTAAPEETLRAPPSICHSRKTN
jgi:hypothetical protein